MTVIKKAETTCELKNIAKADNTTMCHQHCHEHCHEH